MEQHPQKLAITGQNGLESIFGYFLYFSRLKINHEKAKPFCPKLGLPKKL